MCADGCCTNNPGEQEFKDCCQTLEPGKVIFAASDAPGLIQYGVTANGPAYQWEIVAVESGRSRHVAFISTTYCLNQVLNLAGHMSRGVVAALN